MRKIGLLCLFTAIMCSGIFAQSNTPITTIRGTLRLNGGTTSVVSGNITYNVRGLERFIGVIDGLKEGVQVSLEGYAAAPATDGQRERLFTPVRLTLNGKTYEVSSPNTANPGSGRNSSGTGSSGRSR